MDEKTVKAKVDRELFLQQGERIQVSRESWEAFFRSPDFTEKERAADEWADRTAAEWRPLMEQAKAEAKERGIKDWFPLFRAALDRLQADKAANLG